VFVSAGRTPLAGAEFFGCDVIRREGGGRQKFSEMTKHEQS
jgi:hypothetical protein